jgi:hypothetical protein
LLMGRNANSTAMVILHNPSQMTVQFFTFRAPVLDTCYLYVALEKLG